VGLPQLDFRVPEATWFKAVLAGRFSSMPGLSSTGALAWPYKIAVVAVMAIVACGTLVTFGSAGAETPSSSKVSALPGSDEASPTVQGQVVPPSNSLLNGADLLSTLNLTDYSPGDTDLSLFDDDSGDSSDDDSDDDSKLASSTPTPTTTTTTKPTSGTETTSPSPTPTTSSPTTAPPTSAPEPVEGPDHKRWSNCTSSDLNVKLHICGPEPNFES
jgi:hypothetical protein